VTFAVQVDGFGYGTGRTIDDSGLVVDEPDETAVAPGDVICLESEKRSGDYRAVEVSQEGILAFGPIHGPSSRLEVVPWEDILLKVDPREFELQRCDELR